MCDSSVNTGDLAKIVLFRMMKDPFLQEVSPVNLKTFKIFIQDLQPQK